MITLHTGGPWFRLPIY